jgi:hypothetical protein
MLGNILRAQSIAEPEKVQLNDKRIMRAMSDYHSDSRVVPKSGDWLRCSGLPKLCPRMYALAVAQAIPLGMTVGGDLNFVFGIGTAIHRQFQNEWLNQCLPEGVFQGHWRHATSGELCRGERLANPEPLTHGWVAKPQGEYLYEELSFRLPEYRLTGHCDGVLVWPDRTELLEIKTINDYGFAQVSGGFGKPKVEHVLQAQAYMWLSGIEYARIVYFRKKFDALPDMLSEHVIERDEAVIDRIKTLLLDTIDALDGNRTAFERLPECASTQSSRAKYCDMFRPCFNP